MWSGRLPKKRDLRVVQAVSADWTQTDYRRSGITSGDVDEGNSSRSQTGLRSNISFSSRFHH